VASKLRKIYIAGVALLFVGVIGFFQPAYSGQEQTNEKPMYGGGEKSAAQKLADEKLFASIAASGVSHEVAANHAVKRGLEAMKKRNFNAAIRRFNQGWLLNPQSGAVYWGMAAVVADRDHDMVEADQLFIKALTLSPNDPDLRVDYGRFLGKLRWFEQSQGRVEKAKKALEGSTSSFRRALELNSDARDAHAGLASNYAVAGDLERAYHHTRIALKRGEGDGFNMLPILKCLMDKGILNLNDKRALVCMR